MYNYNIAIANLVKAHNLHLDPIPADLESAIIDIEQLCLAAGGELPYRPKVEDLVRTYGVERVHVQAQLLWDRVAASRTPIAKPTAWFIKSVEGDWGPPGPPRAEFMETFARLYAEGKVHLFLVPERHHDDVRERAKRYGDVEIPF